MMQTAGILWHVSLLVPEEVKGLGLGMVGLVRLAPILPLSLWSGVVADAWDRRRVMLVTQSALAVVAVALAVLTFRGLAVVWPVYLLAALSSAAGVFDSADFTWTAVSGDVSEAIILWDDTITDDRLVAFYDTGMTGMKASDPQRRGYTLSVPLAA